LRIMADRYTNIESNAQGTFHLGNDQSRWKGNVSLEFRSSNVTTSQLWQFCPSKAQFGSDALTLQNHINCGQWFLGRNHNLPSLPWTKSSLFIPGFVRPGHEALYQQWYSKYLLYDDEGLPQTKDFQTPTKKTKAQGAFSKLLSGRESRQK